jgi:hypothetical protein
LRDVTRCCELIKYFESTYLKGIIENRVMYKNIHVEAAYLACVMCYYFRLPNVSAKQKLSKLLSDASGTLSLNGHYKDVEDLIA